MNKKGSSITISSSISNIQFVIEWIEKELFINIKDGNIIDSLKLCIQESVVNAIIHGNKNDKEKLVTISYKIVECKLFMKVEDEGDGVPEVLRLKEFKDQSQENIFEESGRGLMLIKHFCQNVKFGKNYILMIIQICENTFSQLKNRAADISVLYVEDNDLLRGKISKKLKLIFDDVDTANNGKNALNLYMHKEYDIVISDIVMPELNGIELIKSIKNVSKSQRVIFLSAYTEIKYLIEAIELRVDGFVFKPIEYEKLYEVLIKVIKLIKITRENSSYKTDLEKLVLKRTEELESTNEELVKMIQEVKKSNYLKEEMKIAQKVQENFLPKINFNSKYLLTASYFKAATYVGGDYYDIFYCNNGNINIIIADVSGHGIAPAITMSTFRGICRATLGTSTDIQEDVQNINSILCEDSKNNDFFITAFFIKYFKEQNKIQYISAGHNEMLHYNIQKDSVDIITSTAIPLGIFENTKYSFVEKTINKDDLMVLYTDGLTEALNENKEMFSFQRLYEIVDKIKNNTPNEIMEQIKTSLSDFIKKETINDDTTILITKFL